MVKVKIYFEGGGKSKEQKVRCREGFRKLLGKSGYKGRMPQTIPCGGRQQAYNDFRTALSVHSRRNITPILLVDSEDPLSELVEEPDDNFAWTHLNNRDNWDQPPGVGNEQVLLMATCMETWICADPETLGRYYGNSLQTKALPSLINLENRNRNDVLRSLVHATKNTQKPYKKGNQSFAVLAVLDPRALEENLTQFRRLLKVLDQLLQ